MKKKIFVSILTLALAGILFFSGYQIYKIFSEYESGERTYDDLEIYVSTPSITSTPQNSSESEKKTENAWPEVDFEGLAAINPDIVGSILKIRPSITRLCRVQTIPIILNTFIPENITAPAAFFLTAAILRTFQIAILLFMGIICRMARCSLL